MHTITFSNRKGGVGKTTSAVQVGACLAKQGKKVLLVDLDPQCNLTQSLLPEPPKHTLFDVVQKTSPLSDTVLSVASNLYVLPCGNSFVSFENHFKGKPRDVYILRDLLGEIERRNDMDYAVLDCPPALNLITLNAYLASTNLYVPIEAQKYSYEGIVSVQQEMEAVRKQNKQLVLQGIFICKYNARTVLSRSIMEHLEETFPGLLMQHHIRRNIALEECPNFYQTIFDYAPESHGAKDYEWLTKEMLMHHEKRKR